MKVVLVNHSDSRGGASVVTVRLLDALRKLGVDASMLVVHKSLPERSDIISVGNGISTKAAFLREHIDIYTSNGFNRADLFKVSTAVAGLPLHKHPLIKQADVVILNWINQGMLSLEEIGRIAAMGKTIIWTMHDMWNLTGICHHAGECEAYKNIEGCSKCPFVHRKPSCDDISARTFRRKRQLYSNADIHFVAVSTWLAKKAAESELLREASVTVIPNAFPVEDFAEIPKYSFKDLELPEDRRFILMGAARLDDPIKGLEYAIEALNKLHHRKEDNDVCAVFFGDIRDPELLDKVELPHIYLGRIDDAKRLHALYARSKVVISTSLYETLPGTLIEGQGAGCYAVSFDRGGQADIIDRPPWNGWLAPFGDTDSICDGLFAGLSAQADAGLLQRSVAEKFSAENVAEKYLRLLRKTSASD